MVNSSTPPDRKPLSETIPPAILVATGIIYASGFLVVLAFLDRFGIREAGAEFWKARYIHIGILCISFPLILNGTILSIVHLVFHGKFDKPVMWQRIFPVGLLLINLEIVCYVLIMLTNRTSDGHIAGLSPILWILGISVLGVVAILVVERVIEGASTLRTSKAANPSAHSHSFVVTTRWLLVTVVGAIDVWFFADFQQTGDQSESYLAVIYLGLCLLFGVIISIAVLYTQRQPNTGRRRAVAVFAAAIIGPFAYIIVLSFSYGVFQNIPATRGGGDYTQSPKVIITFKDKPATTASDRKYFDQNSEKATIALTLIEETSWAFYLADPIEAGGPLEWKKIGGRKPNIFIANKAEVAKVFSESRNALSK